jgi:cysteine synthase
MERSLLQRRNVTQIGHTPVIEKPDLSEFFGIRHLFIKDESANPYGTHKDRKSLSVVMTAISTAPHLRPEALCILTAGNAGLSLAKIAAVYDLPVTAFVNPNTIPPQTYARLEAVCEQVISLDTERRRWGSDELKDLAGAKDGRRVVDATNGITDPFEAIIDEICNINSQLRPDVIILPVGGGELFLGVANGLIKNGLKTRLIGVTVTENSVADKLYSKWNPQANYIAEITRAASPHQLCCLDDEALILDTYRWLKKTSQLDCEPSSAAAFAALFQIRPWLRTNDKVLVLNTGTSNI